MLFFEQHTGVTKPSRGINLLSGRHGEKQSDETAIQTPSEIMR
jgi:hypothetical protein